MLRLALERLQEKLTKENLWLYILQLLRTRELYAYEIRDKIKDAFGFETAKITIYVVLYKMEREGLVNSVTERRENANTTRRYYKPTEAGMRALEGGKVLLRKALESLEDQPGKETFSHDKSAAQP